MFWLFVKVENILFQISLSATTINTGSVFIEHHILKVGFTWIQCSDSWDVKVFLCVYAFMDFLKPTVKVILWFLPDHGLWLSGQQSSWINGIVFMHRTLLKQTLDTRIPFRASFKYTRLSNTGSLKYERSEVGSLLTALIIKHRGFPGVQKWLIIFFNVGTTGHTRPCFTHRKSVLPVLTTNILWDVFPPSAT